MSTIPEEEKNPNNGLQSRKPRGGYLHVSNQDRHQLLDLV